MFAHPIKWAMMYILNEDGWRNKKAFHAEKKVSDKYVITCPYLHLGSLQICLPRTLTQPMLLLYYLPATCVHSFERRQGKGRDLQIGP